ERRRDAQLVPGLGMAAEQVAELDELERGDRLARDEELVPRLELLGREPVRVDAGRAEPLEPAALDDAHAPLPVAVEPFLDVLVRRVLLRVEARSGAVAGEPVEPPVTRVDRPDERLVE